MGFLKITFGPMFSGKTTALITELHMYKDWSKSKSIKSKCLIINSTSDKRKEIETGDLTNHSSCKKEINKNILTLKVDNLSDVPNDLIDECDYIAIDECQFFPDLLNRVQIWVKELNKKVYCYGLIADDKKEKFGYLIDLMPIADVIEQKFALCHVCGEKAPFTFYIGNGKKEQVEVGSHNYIPLCGKQHF